MSVKIITGTWADSAPHLTQEVKDALYESIPPYLRDARTKGIPVLGAGLIYPIAEEEMVVDPFPIPDTFQKGFGMDVGWNRTAVGWFARNPETKVIYNYDFYYQGGGPVAINSVAIHSASIRSRGDWIPGVIDPRSDGRSQIDGQQLFILYTRRVWKGGGGLDLTKADNSITTGISLVWDMLTGGRLKIFRNITPFWEEIRQYRRKADEDETGKIVKKNDHYLDQLRYFCMSGIARMRTQGKPDGISWHELLLGGGRSESSGRTWMSGG